MKYQIKTKSTSALAVMHSADFRRGVEDVQAGRAFPRLETTWDYERGRLFGTIYPHIKLKKHRKVTEEALRAFMIAQIEGAMI